ncbi:MAG: ArsS family sensor histidine kinase [Campylobacterales bacterium]|nr:ArsS family sensor histidine kinase [Campylobacterales bacterium]
MISRRHSVFFKLHAFFALALIILTLLFFSALGEQEHQKYRLLVHRSMELSQTLESLKNHTCESQNHSLMIAGFKEIKALNRHAKEVTLPLQMKQTLQRTQLHVVIYQDKEGISYALIRDHCTMFYRDMSEKNTYYFVWLLFFTLFGGLVSMYLLLWRNLLPLKQLYEQIKRYGEGKEIHTASNTGKDEIALISNALFDALEKQHRLKSSRELFLRNIMHELKTPITKGKLIVELEESRPNILLLGKLFSRLDHLVHQMAQVEKMHAFALQCQKVNVNTLLTIAMDNLLLENDHVSLSGCNTTINVDPNLFTSALQNLLDNAVRHATTLPVLVECTNKNICIKNSGKPLKRPVEEALQAFVTERGEGELGLGLYIAQSVCELHNFQLTYRYEEGIHTFCIEF